MDNKTDYLIKFWSAHNPVAPPPIEHFLRTQCEIFLKWFEANPGRFEGRIPLDEKELKGVLESLFTLVEGESYEAPGHGRNHILRVIMNALSIAARECNARQAAGAYFGGRFP